MNTNKTARDFILNIDTANDEIARLDKQLADANLTPGTTPKAQAPGAIRQQTPSKILSNGKELSGVSRAIAANLALQGESMPADEPRTNETTGLARAVAANRRLQGK